LSDERGHLGAVLGHAEEDGIVSVGLVLSDGAAGQRVHEADLAGVAVAALGADGALPCTSRIGRRIFNLKYIYD
jgi:hypothetical protein